MRYLFTLVRVVLDHSPKWWFTLFAAWVGGIGIFATDAAWRASYNVLAGGLPLMPLLPDQWSIWWLLIPFVIWVFVSLLNREVHRRDREARIYFDEPFVENFGIEETTKDLETGKQSTTIRQVCMAKIRIRNQPNNMSEGREIKQAYSIAEFRDFNTQRLIFTVEHPRWTENKKPRSDEMDKPKFTAELNFRDLHANAFKHCIDMAFKVVPEAEFYGFRGLSQNAGWQEQQFQLAGRQYLIRLVIHGAGLEKAAEQWMVITNERTNGNLRIESKEAIDARNWTGSG